MKKVFLALLASMSLALTGCNYDTINLNNLDVYHIHISLEGQSTPVHLNVESWSASNGVVFFTTEKYGTIMLGEGDFIAYDSDECPICGKVVYK